MLMSMYKKAYIELPEMAGWHSLSRRVVTDVYDKTSAKKSPSSTSLDGATSEGI